MLLCIYYGVLNVLLHYYFAARVFWMGSNAAFVVFIFYFYVMRFGWLLGNCGFYVVAKALLCSY